MELMLQALADPHRREIVEMLLEEEHLVGDLVRRLPIAQSGVSRHLRILRDAGIVHSRADGQKRFYALRPEPFEELSVWLGRYRRLWESRLDNFEIALQRRQPAKNPGNEEK
jgi:DNA-binding transcriptional ArsR family regulator